MSPLRRCASVWTPPRTVSASLSWNSRR
jgi:hypothetical protein